MHHKILKDLTSILTGILIAAILMLSSWWFVSATKEKALQTRNKITITHNEIAQLPQPNDIDLGVPSGSIMSQLEHYRRTAHKYENLSFNHPSALRLQVAGWLSLDHVAPPATEPATLSNKYETFINTYSQLISALEKPLVYDPEPDLHGLDQESEEFKQRLRKAKSSLLAARNQIVDIQISTEAKDSITQELASWAKAAETSSENSTLSAWSQETNTHQKSIRNTMQDHWMQHISSLSNDKQSVIYYYTKFYQ